MLKAIHAAEDRQARADKAEAVIVKLGAMKLRQAAQKIRENVHETLTYYDLPSVHWQRIRTSNPLGRILREIGSGPQKLDRSLSKDWCGQ
jgi:transposase-like protein